MNSSARIPTPVAELLAAEAAGDIDREERARLDALLSGNVLPSRDEMLTAAGLAQLAFLKQDDQARVGLPDALRARLLLQADAWNAGRQARSTSGVTAPVADLDNARRRRAASVGQRPLPWWRTRSAAGWYVAAALALAVVAPRLATVPAVVPAAESAQSQRATLLREAADVVTVPWSPSTEPGYEQARGDVVWSDARQEGYLRIAGLPVNDRSRAQYQLWVVDPGRDVHPVDGGVFDVTQSGELVIPVRTKLAVHRPAAFAVTLEQPGGVVVSDGPMLLVAAVGG